MNQQFLLCLVAIFVAMDPIGNVPIFLGLTGALGEKKKKEIAKNSIFIAFLVAICFLFLGKNIFHFLGIEVNDFKIAGGIVLLLVSLMDLLNGPDTKETSGNTGIVPMAVPLITGPGVITTIILQEPLAGTSYTFLALVLNFAVSYFSLIHAPKIGRLLGKDGTVVISKISALLLAAIAVSMIRTGIIGALPGVVH